MKPDDRFRYLTKDFWANVRMISEGVGYTERTTRKNPNGGKIKVPTGAEIKQAVSIRGLNYSHIMSDSGQLTQMGQRLIDYYEYRADALNAKVEGQLMNAEKARRVFEQLRGEFRPNCPIPMNKQKGDKKAPAFFTGIINILIESNSQGLPCDYDPRKLTTVTRNGRPLRTLSRRIDGAFPSTVNPVAVWEIKEYYYTTTFGSRVADGVYELLLDGMELEELYEHENIEVKHYLMVDAHYTWWEMGKSYLCRLIDMLHMGYVDEILFGYEVVDRLPDIVKEWVAIASM